MDTENIIYYIKALQDEVIRLNEKIKDISDEVIKNSNQINSILKILNKTI